MQRFAQHRAVVGLLLAGLLAVVEVAWEPWHVASVDHLDSADVAGHAKTGSHRSHHRDHDEHHDHEQDEEQEHEHHPVMEHEKSWSTGRIHSPVFVAAALLIAVVETVAPESSEVVPDQPSVRANESPPDRRFSQRGPPRA